MQIGGGGGHAAWHYLQSLRLGLSGHLQAIRHSYSTVDLDSWFPPVSLNITDFFRWIKQGLIRTLSCFFSLPTFTTPSPVLTARKMCLFLSYSISSPVILVQNRISRWAAGLGARALKPWTTHPLGPFNVLGKISQHPLLFWHLICL